MECIPNCQKCNYTNPYLYCCSDFCMQLHISVWGYCKPRNGSGIVCPNTYSTTTTEKNVGGTISSDKLATVEIVIYFLLALLLLLCIGGIGIFLVMKRRWKLDPKEGLSYSDIKRFFEGFNQYVQNQNPESKRLMDAGGKEDPYDIEGMLCKIEDSPYNRKYEIPVHGFTVDKAGVLGSGAFGLVLKGTLWTNGVAVKTTEPGNVPKLKALLSEIKILIHLGKHENIVCLLGAHTSELKSGIVYAFLELCPHGNLLNYLRANRNDKPDRLSTEDQYERLVVEKDSSNIGINDMILWNFQVASALKFLADQKVTHGDVACRNVLLYKKNYAKLTDFGLSRRLYDYTNYVKSSQEPLPWRWMAIETLREMKFSPESDVWSFGITMWEIFSYGDVPYAGLAWSQEFTCMLIEGLRLPKPKGCTDAIYELMCKCWANAADHRPTCLEICKSLESILCTPEKV